MVAVALSVGTAAALAGAGLLSGRATAQAGAPTIKVTERDFHITAPKRVAAGDLTLVVKNNGPDTHELIVVREDRARLPLRSDGLTIDEEAVQKRTAGSLDGGGPGSVRRLKVHLSPGRYVLFCNMAGHYMGGMHAELIVR